jgi:choline dehydrogenase-like flavoprotein
MTADADVLAAAEAAETSSGSAPLVRPAAEPLDRFERSEAAVIGSGPGASLAACLLAEAGRETLVLEEGEFWPLEDPPAFSSGEMRRKYRNGGLTMALGRPPILYVEGRCLGGGSEVNSGLHHRLPDEVVWSWATRRGLDDFSPESLRPHAEAVEADLSVSLTPPDSLPAASLLLKAGAEALGWSCLEVPRWRLYGPRRPDGERRTMTRTYLPRAQAAGARIVCGARVERVRAVGSGWEIDVEQLAPESTAGPDGPKARPRRSTVAARNVFLGAGTVGSPAVLRRSKLAASAGRFLSLHPTIKIVAQFGREINRPDLGVPVHQVKAFGSAMSLGCSISSPHYLAAAMASRPGGLELVRDLWSTMAVYYAMIVPEGRGWTTSLPGFREPLVRFGLTGADLAALSTALKRLGRLLFASGAVRLFPTVRGLGPFDGPEDLKKIPAQLPAARCELMTIHLTSSNAMGGSPRLGVVDPWGALWGARNFFVCDASILCSAPGVNPQGPLLTVVHRNMSRFLGG